MEDAVGAVAGEAAELVLVGLALGGDGDGEDDDAQGVHELRRHAHGARPAVPVRQDHEDLRRVRVPPAPPFTSVKARLTKENTNL